MLVALTCLSEFRTTNLSSAAAPAQQDRLPGLRALYVLPFSLNRTVLALVLSALSKAPAPFPRSAASDFQQLTLMRAADPNPKRVHLLPYNSNTNRKSIEIGTRCSDNVHPCWGDTVSDTEFSLRLDRARSRHYDIRHAHTTLWQSISGSDAKLF